MKRPNNCRRCGKIIEDKKYNPYNVTFGAFACSDEEKKMCLKCAEDFVKYKNKLKGGSWVLDKDDFEKS